MKYLVTLRVTFDAEDELEARLIGNEIQEVLDKHVLEDDDTVDVTQVIPYGLLDQTTPEEIVAYMRRTVDLLISTRIVQCVELAQELDKTAWVLEHRDEHTFDITNYDYAAFQQRISDVLGRQRRG